MSNAIDLKGRLVFLMVTGASKGIGAKMAIETSKELAPGSVVVIIARSAAKLEETKMEILKGNSGLIVHAYPMNLEKPSIEDMRKLFDKTFDAAVKFDLAMIIHNVGTLGDTSRWVREIDCYEELQEFYNMNVFAPTILNNVMLKFVPYTTQRFIVNITSKAAIHPIKSFGFYGPSRAAREMMFRTLAEEEEDLLVLNYSPGPVETDMTKDAQQNSGAEETCEMFKELRKTGTILTTEQTAKRFLEVVAKGNYKSGDHVDYYDEI